METGMRSLVLIHLMDNRGSQHYFFFIYMLLSWMVKQKGESCLNVSATRLDNLPIISVKV